MMNKIKLTVLLLIGINLHSFSQDFYDINTINTIEITFEESNWDYLLDQLVSQGEEERLLGSVTINGQEFDSVGVRYKGNSSYSSNQVKNPLNIKLDYTIGSQDIEGYGTIKLANVFKDPSFIREVMSYEIARNYFPACESNFANVYINGTHLGLYTSDQSVDKFFAQTHYGSNENARLKGEISSNGPPSGSVWKYLGDDTTGYSSFYDLKSDYGWEDLTDFLDTLGNHNEHLEEVLNIDRHLWFLAFSNLLVNLDGPINNPQNYYIYKDNNGRFNPTVWDLNESFGVFRSHQTLGNLSTTQAQQFSPYANLNESNFPIISKVLSIDEYKKMYVAHMKTIIEEHFIDDQYEARALEIQDIIASDVQADQNKFYSYSDFTNNLYNSVGGGPQSTIGIVQLMDTRINYLMSQTDFQYEAPEIADVAHSPSSGTTGSEIWVTAEVDNAEDIKLAFRSNSYGVFEKIEMFDDGMHEDGSAGDGIYGASLIAASTNIQYYIYAENNNASAFMPVRAEYEFFEIPITSFLVINEFMADNEATIMDQDDEYEDWIELYNNGETDINLNGYFLTDDPTEMDKWAFPDTTIFAGDYLIVWADKDEEQEGLHAEFKLSANGEMIIISDPNRNLIDEVSFDIQKPDTTTGRLPNGTGEFLEMLPTFGAENTELIIGINNEFISSLQSFTSFPNPFSKQTNIVVEFENDSDVAIEIYNFYGQKIDEICNTNLASGKHHFIWNASQQEKGVYMCKMELNSEIHTIKLIVL